MNTEHKSNTPVAIRDLWRTPKALFDYYDKRFDFTTDVACTPRNCLCDEGISLEDGEDSLADDCVWGERNWCNPPYSQIMPWVCQALTQMTVYECLTVMILPADTSVKWFKLAFEKCTECHFISGRISFINEETGKPVSGNNKGSVVFVFDPNSPIKQAVSLIDRDEIMVSSYEQS